MELKKRSPRKGSSIAPPYSLGKSEVSLVLETDWQPYGWYSELTIILIELTKYTKFKLICRVPASAVTADAVTHIRSHILPPATHNVLWNQPRAGKQQEQGIT